MRRKITRESYPGYLVGVFLVLAALVLWITQTDIFDEYSGWKLTFTVLAKVGAFGGMAAFSYALLLSGRLYSLERLFGGLDKMIYGHRWFGAIGFLLLTLHPTMLSLRLADDSVSRALSFWLPSGSLSINLGRAGFYIVVLAIVWSIFGRLKHANFISVHQTLGLAFLLGSLHAFLLPSGNLAENYFLRYYLLALSAAGIGVYFYQSIFDEYFVKRYPYQLKQVRKLSKDVVELVLWPRRRMLKFAPGQFAYVAFDSKDIDPESHPYSFSSSTNTRELRFTVKALGDHTRQLQKIKKGTPVTIEGPYGGFSYKNIKPRRQVWLAGGIGITPFLSMARSLDPEAKYEVTLFYAAKDKIDALFEKELMKLSRELPNFKVIPYYENEKGFLNVKAIQGHVTDLHDKAILLCGPPAMLDNLSSQLMDIGVSRDCIHYEKFSY